MDNLQATSIHNCNVFKNKCVLIFKQWNSFRILLDNNPNILTYYNEDHSILEINELLDNLYEELYEICKEWNTCKKDKEKCINEIAECLISFIEDYFQIALDDNSNVDVAKGIVRLYENGYDAKEMDGNVFGNGFGKYKIDFPIVTEKEKMILEEENDDDECEENEMKGQVI